MTAGDRKPPRPQLRLVDSPALPPQDVQWSDPLVSLHSGVSPLDLVPGQLWTGTGHHARPVYITEVWDEFGMTVARILDCPEHGETRFEMHPSAPSVDLLSSWHAYCGSGIEYVAPKAHGPRRRRPPAKSRTAWRG